MGSLGPGAPRQESLDDSAQNAMPRKAASW